MKKLFILLLLTIPIISFGQDTIHVKKVAVVNVLINPKTRKIVKKWVRHTKVKKGYIVNLYSNVWEVNGKLMYSDNNRDYSFVK